MQTSSLRSLTVPLRPFYGKGFDRRKKHCNSSVLSLKRDAYDKDHNGRLVDDNMIVLRKRIHEMKAAETNDAPPASWMEWEKRYYPNYDSDVCEAVGYLQSMLMETRPSLALGMMVLVILSISTSAAVVVLQLMEVVQGF